MLKDQSLEDQYLIQNTKYRFTYRQDKKKKLINIDMFKHYLSYFKIYCNSFIFLYFRIHQDALIMTEKKGQPINYEKPKCWP